MSAAHAATPGPLVVDSNTAELPFRVYSKSTQGNVAYFYSEADAERFAAHDSLVLALEALLCYDGLTDKPDRADYDQARAALKKVGVE